MVESDANQDKWDEIFSSVLGHDVMASDMPLTFTGMYNKNRLFEGLSPLNTTDQYSLADKLCNI